MQTLDAHKGDVMTVETVGHIVKFMVRSPLGNDKTETWEMVCSGENQAKHIANRWAKVWNKTNY